MDQTRIEKEMREIEGLIEFKFKDILWLSKAMYAKRIVVPGEGKNHREYANDSLATVGDTLLKFVLADKLYQEGKHIRGVITSEKSDTENNDIMYKVVSETGIIDYAYHDTHFYKDNPPDHEKVTNSTHTQYLEAIIGAIYYDSGYERARQWIYEWALPKLNAK